MPIIITPKDPEGKEPKGESESGEGRKRGGKVMVKKLDGVDVASHEPKPKAYNAQGSEVEREATEKRDARAARKEGGRLMKKHTGGKRVDEILGEEKKHRLDRPGRKSGGSVGANKAPLSTAATIRPAEGRKQRDDVDYE